MNTEALQQIGEIAKNVSIAFDGKLNSETLVKVTQEVTPRIMGYLYFLQVKSFAVHILWAGAVVVSAYLIGKTILKMIKEQ